MLFQSISYFFREKGGNVLDIQQLNSVKSVQIEIPNEGKEKILMTFDRYTKAGKYTWFFYDNNQNVLTMKFQDGCLEVSLKLAKDYAS